jgi:hypothetical protein
VVRYEKEGIHLRLGGRKQYGERAEAAVSVAMESQPLSLSSNPQDLRAWNFFSDAWKLLLPKGRNLNGKGEKRAKTRVRRMIDC